MSVSLAGTLALTVTEVVTFTCPDLSSTTQTFTHNGFNTALSLTGSTTPPVSQVSSFAKALSAGAATIDLTSLANSIGGTFDGTSLSVKAYKFQNPSTNANAITVTFGASNPYLLGGTGWKWILQPGQEIMGYAAAGAPTIDSTHKNIDLAGTGSQALNVELILG